VQDDESGLVYMRARYYEESSGRFVSADPALSESNLFAYCGSDPVNRTDCSGRFWEVLQALWKAILPMLQSFGIKATAGMLTKMVAKLGAYAAGRALMALGSALIRGGVFLEEIAESLAISPNASGRIVGAVLTRSSALAIAAGTEVSQLGLALVYLWEDLSLPGNDDFEGGGGGGGPDDGVSPPPLVGVG
jgi:hypothetical protein